jgi:hypothetical protein
LIRRFKRKILEWDLPAEPLFIYVCRICLALQRVPLARHLFGYAQATNTRALALVGDADANANAHELRFSFASFEGKRQFLHLVRTNEDMVNDYIVEKGGP